MMNEIPQNNFDRALTLRNLVIALATGGDLNESAFRELRADFLDNPNTKQLLPRFIRTNLDKAGLWSYFKSVHTGNGAYAVRREHIYDKFQPLLEYLENEGAPADSMITDVLSRYDGEGVAEAWQKAISRRNSDPEGAITAARTLLEEVCKHVLEDAGGKYEDKWDLPKLYSNCAKQINLAPSQHTEDTFKRILGGCHTVVENIGALRNKISDAHGGGRRKVRPDVRHAALVVNLAGSMAMFLIETWQASQQKISKDDTSTEQDGADIIYKKVMLSSRYSVQSEIDDMKSIIDVLTPSMARRLESIWCDSKASAVYSITVRKGQWTSRLPQLIDKAIMKSCIGHNGVFFEGDTAGDAYLDPNWPED